MLELGFLIKKIIGVVLMPLPISCLLILFALYWLNRGNKKLAIRVFVLGLAVLLFFSTPIISSYLIKPLEFSVPKLELSKLDDSSLQYIVVLGCWHTDDPLLPLVAKLDQCSLPRVVQAVQIWRQFPESLVIFSGFDVEHEAKENLVKQSDPEVNSELAISLGLPKSNIILIEGAKDTEDEVTSIKAEVQQQPVIVISSATHMLRVKKLFNFHGISPLLSPAEYLSGHGAFSWQLFIPNARALHQSERALYEYMGISWVSLRNWIINRF